MYYRGTRYNIPMSFWIPEMYPQHAPITFVSPTENMIIKPKHKHVDTQGRCYSPYLSRVCDDFFCLYMYLVVVVLYVVQEWLTYSNVCVTLPYLITCSGYPVHVIFMDLSMTCLLSLMKILQFIRNHQQQQVVLLLLLPLLQPFHHHLLLLLQPILIATIIYTTVLTTVIDLAPLLLPIPPIITSRPPQHSKNRIETCYWRR